jgi:hypothetical protein
MAPRGIVAASVASLFAFELSMAGIEGADQLVGMTFLVIVGTVVLYGLTAEPIARRLGLSEVDPQGVLIVGAQQIGRDIGLALQELGFKVVLLDTNEWNIEMSRAAKLQVVHGNALSEDIIEEVDFSGIGRLLALTSNDEVNALANLHFGEVFDRSQRFQLPVAGEHIGSNQSQAYLRGRFLFDSSLDYKFLMGCLNDGWKIRAIQIMSNSFSLEALKDQYQGDIFPLFLTRDDEELMIYTINSTLVPVAGQTLVVLVPPTATKDSWADEEFDHAILEPGKFMGVRGDSAGLVDKGD